MPLLRDTFDVVEVIPYGGAILHLLFNEIAFHFLSDEPEVKAILAECFAREDELMREGKLPSDFVIAVCRKRQRGVDAG